MGLLSRLMDSPPLGAFTPDDDFWYSPVGTSSAAGVAINQDSALKVSTVYACISAVAGDVAEAPLSIFRRLERGREEARNHPLWELLHDQPNESQSSYEYRETMTALAMLRGNAYSRIIPGPRGFANELIILDPSRMKVDRLANRRLRYTYSNEEGRQEVYPQEEIFHLRNLGSDGIVGLSTLSLARESLGLALAAEKHGAQTFGQGATPDGVLQMDGRLDPEAAERLASGWHNAHTGRRRVAVLENGVKWQQVAMTNTDAQFLELRGWQVEDVARWFGPVPLHRIGHTEKATSWGTGIEQFNIGYVTFVLLKWAVRWEQAIRRQLILAPDTYFAKHNFNSYLRGNSSARSAFYQSAINTGYMTPNEVRELEELNPREGGDSLRIPQNMALLQEDGTIQPVNDGNWAPGGTPFDARARLLSYECASREVRRELTAIPKAAARLADDPEGWRAWLDDYYQKHAIHITETLHLDEAVATDYAESQKATILRDGLAALETWEETIIPRLASLVLGEITEWEVEA